jgi:hypothetical protein
MYFHWQSAIILQKTNPQENRRFLSAANSHCYGFSLGLDF